MYSEFYSLNGMPFQLTPDSRFNNLGLRWSGAVGGEKQAQPPELICS